MVEVNKIATTVYNMGSYFFAQYAENVVIYFKIS